MTEKMRRGHKVKVCTENSNFNYTKEIFTPVTVKSHNGIEYIKFKSNVRKQLI